MLPYFGSLDTQVVAALVATSGTVLAAVATVVYSQRRTKDREIAEAHRPVKVEIYKRYMEALFELLLLTKKESLPDTLDERWARRFMDLKRDLIVWGSPGILRAWTKFERESMQKPAKERVLMMDDILREIRKDLGNSNWLLQRGDLVQMFINDDLRSDSFLKE